MSFFGSGASATRRAQMTAEAQRMNGMNQAMGYLDQGANTAAGLIGQNKPIYDNAYGTARDAIGGGYDAAINASKGVNNYLMPLYQTGLQSNSAWADAMGFNGAEGSARSSQAFRATPGIQDAIRSGEDSITRQASVTGGLASGNILKALQNEAIKTTNSFHGQYMDRLAGGQNMGLQAASGMGQNDLANASLHADRGNALAGLAMNHGNNLAGINNAQAGIYAGLGDSKAGLVQGTYNQLANDGISATNTINQNRANRNANLLSFSSGVLNFLGGR